MYRKAGDSEACRDVFVAQQGIGSNPAAELARELARLLHRGFRHQDQKFVPTVSRPHTPTAAILLEDVTDTLQDDVAFEVAIEVIHELEAVQVHQHEGEGAICAR